MEKLRWRGLRGRRCAWLGCLCECPSPVGRAVEVDGIALTAHAQQRDVGASETADRQADREQGGGESRKRQCQKMGLSKQSERCFTT